MGQMIVRLPRHLHSQTLIPDALLGVSYSGDMKSSSDGYGVNWASGASGMLCGAVQCCVGLSSGRVGSRRWVATGVQAFLVVVLAQGPAAD